MRPSQLWCLYIVASASLITAFTASAEPHPRVVYARPAALLCHNSAKQEITINSTLERNDALETNKFGHTRTINV